ncbi:hypothetical protein Lupro_02995 [Lutibacter profundi]|uniref:Uncharacterized protein n=1 Tax=Lutibacter profundi TaxID=1622118 RepID=A0A109RN43_9FLAO|nr:hypothetical protein [Lutibacter profundi]AMC10282.1 hypothetical protein Lupro_02995 [Lutibacter profundi]
MTESIKHFFNLLFDNSKSWTFRTAAGISIIGFLILTDITLSFTYNIYINNKIDQLEKIQTLKKDYKYDSLKLKKIVFLENKILNKEHYTEFLSRNLSNISFKSSIKDQNVNQSTTDTITTTKPIQSLFWMVFSSNYLLVLISPFLILLPVYNRESRTGAGILGWFASLVMIVAIVTLITWISYQIPLIWHNPIWNYILNFLIHTLLLILIVKLNKKN